MVQRKDEFDITVFDIKSYDNVRLFKKYKNDINIVYGDISNDEDVKKATVGIDGVIHLAALIPPLSERNHELTFQINTIGTQNLIRNLEEHSPNAFFVYSSSISIYGDRLENPNISVEDPIMTHEDDYYAQTKVKAEKIIQESKLDWTIFRLSAIMGKHKLTKLLFEMPLKTMLEIATPEDTARAFVNAMSKREVLKGRIFNLGGGEAYRTTYKEFLTRSFEIFGLGGLDFPTTAFAEKGFHCGYYIDGDELEEILKFRWGTIEDYYKREEEKVPLFRRWLTSLYSYWIKKILLRLSSPRKKLRKEKKLKT